MKEDRFEWALLKLLNKKPILVYNKSDMQESEKFNNIVAILKQNQQLKQLIKLINNLATKYPNFASEDFLNSPDKTLLVHQLQLLNIPELQNIMSSIKLPQSIVALPLSEGANYSLFFAIVPNNHQFDWHSHPEMFGVSKCLYGQLQISTLNKAYLKQYKPGKYVYAQRQLKVYQVNTQNQESTSMIVPGTENIHKIKALKPSAFLDLLMPDYPEDRCDFYELRGEKNQNLWFKAIGQPKQRISSWKDYLDQILRSEKQIVKNVILKLEHNQ